MILGKKKFILAADMGGTKTFVALFNADGDSTEPLHEARFENSFFKSAIDVFGKFLDEAEKEAKVERGDIAAATIGVAAPVCGNSARLTNLDWAVDAGELKSSTGIERISLINDLVATAWGLPMLSPSGDDIVSLNLGVGVAGNVAIIAPGTGLGQSILFYDENFDDRRHLVSATEGGHTDFAPNNMGEIGLLTYLRELYGHVSYERILSGQGIKNIYDFLAAQSPVPKYLEQRFETEDPAKVIVEEGMLQGKKDLACKEAVTLFASVLGAEAGNLALKSMAVGGVYIAGGIAPKIIDALKEPDFMRAFLSKGRFRKFMSAIPVRVVLNPKTALLGAMNHARSNVAGKPFKLI